MPTRHLHQMNLLYLKHEQHHQGQPAESETRMTLDSIFVGTMLLPVVVGAAMRGD